MIPTRQSLRGHGRGRRPRPVAWLAAALAALALLLALPARAAFTPPPLEGHVVDTAGKLTRAEALELDAKLEAVRQRTGFEIVVFLAGSLEGETIEDVAYETFNAWGIGRERLDNGVLLVIAPAERRVRIETGQGVGGALTDLESNDIIRRQIAPRLREGRFRDAVDQGTQAIADALVADTPGAKPPPPRAPDAVTVGVGAGVLLLVIVLSIISPAFRAMLWFLLQAILWSRGGGGGGGGGSGYRGGGGRSGGGGSSDSY
ncbi:MAG: TPM domain-containing protein [Polyangiaceae bacterium]|nr:TPM domain-containing protein [Polyangiaceae bacterium]